ncbi:hypothetical protein PAP_01670 [Palaeococcus pacificus DY20341]|uniref:VanZ-like domain-containing protein n=1 Tax=Palaeococcus pacificus DY20341 TaxID=1343739 RepID=A0A075LWA7_9EURY|nr:hypothetical protein PAP_01670 [Palaeococcus pacificus DY20341]
MALIGLYIPDIVQNKFPHPPDKLKHILKPIYNDKTMAVLGVFIAVHVSLVNVPFTTIDLFHKEWRDADMISHFLGGLTVWLITAEVVNEFSNHLSLKKRQFILYSFLLFFTLGIGWEIAEKLSEGEISFIRETAGNKVRDIIMDTLGALFGLYLVEEKRFPFRLKLNNG